jgi:predicted ArsR family transcriptional regulator
MQDILQYLKLTGEKHDSEIAAATGISLAEVRLRVSELSAKGDVIVCRSIRFKDGKPIDTMLCRMSGFIPPAAPGRKPKART